MGEKKIGKANRKPPACQKCHLGPKGLSRVPRFSPTVGLQMGPASAELCPPHVPFICTLSKGAQSNDLQIYYTFPLHNKSSCQQRYPHPSRRAVTGGEHGVLTDQSSSAHVGEFHPHEVHLEADGPRPRSQWGFVAAHNPGPRSAVHERPPSALCRTEQSWLWGSRAVFGALAAVFAGDAGGIFSICCVFFFNVCSWSADSGETMWVFYSARRHFTRLQAYFLHSGSLCPSLRASEPLQLWGFTRFGDRQSFYVEFCVEAAQQ